MSVVVYRVEQDHLELPFMRYPTDRTIKIEEIF